jgi:hypothetical protein
MFPSGRYRAKLIFQREMEHGHSETDITKVVMMGIAGSGKSTALDTIMEEEPLAPEDRHSTPIMKRPVKTMVIVVDGKTKWVKKEQHQFTAHLATRLNTDPTPPQEATPTSHALSNTTQSPPTSASPDSSSHTPSSHRPPKSATGKSATATQSITAALLQPGPSLSPELSVDALLQSTEVEEEFVSLISQATGSPKPLVHERWLFLIDSGGQTEFQDAFSVFLPHTSVCVFVFKLSEPLDSYPVIEYYRNGQLVGRGEQSLLTNRDIFEKYMRTMFSFNNRVGGKTEKEAAAIQESSLQPAQPVELPGDEGGHSPEPAECQDHSSNEDHSPECRGAEECSSEEDSSSGQPPRILLLGTHRDLKHLCETETVEQKNEQLEALIPEKLKKQVIYSADKKPIFEINGLTPDKDDKRMAETIRECIMHECPSRREKTPWRWHVFNQKMKSIARRLKRNVLSREECLKIAASVGLDKESFQLSLEFFHNLSLIFYYPSILPDVVFVDPQVLLDKVSELVQFTFELKDPSPTPDPPDGWQQFEQFAQVTDKFLKDSRFSSHYHEAVFTRKHLTTLLERLLVFARLSPDTWFMPCVLKHLKPEEIRPHCVSPSPLVVRFHDGGPQHGVCCSLIAHVLSTANRHPCPWSVRLAHNSPACLYRNCIQFQVSDYNGFALLIDRYTYFEVHVRTSRSKLLEVWRHVRCAVFSGLESVSTKLGYSNNKPSPAILCPSHTTANSSHPAYIRNKEWTCSLDRNEFDSVASLKDQIPEWLEETEYKEGFNTKKSVYTRPEKWTDTIMADVTVSTGSSEEVLSSLCVTQSISRLGEKPTLPTLLRLKVPSEVGTKYFTFGVLLLDDLTGKRVESIRYECHDNPERITQMILGEWLEGKGLPVTWQSLVKSLRDMELFSLADVIQQNF